MPKYIFSLGVPSIKCTQPGRDLLSQNKFTALNFPWGHTWTPITQRNSLLYFLLYIKTRMHLNCSHVIRTWLLKGEFSNTSYRRWIRNVVHAEFLSPRSLAHRNPSSFHLGQVSSSVAAAGIWQEMRFPWRHRSQSGPDSPRTTPCFHPRSKLQIKELLWMFLSGRTCLTC